jgi:hypothetical protein
MGAGHARRTLHSPDWTAVQTIIRKDSIMKTSSIVWIVIVVLVVIGLGWYAFSGSNSSTASLPQPVVTAISPATGTAAGGDTVMISGSGFTGTTQVNFGYTPAASFVLNSDSSITATSPSGSAGTTDITVVTANGTSATNPGDQFTYAASTATTTPQ